MLLIRILLNALLSNNGQDTCDDVRKKSTAERSVLPTSGTSAHAGAADKADERWSDTPTGETSDLSRRDEVEIEMTRSSDEEYPPLPPPPVSVVFIPINADGREAYVHGCNPFTHRKTHGNDPYSLSSVWDDETIEAIEENSNKEIRHRDARTMADSISYNRRFEERFYAAAMAFGRRRAALEQLHEIDF